MAKSSSKRSPPKRMAAGWREWKPLEPFSQQEQQQNYEQYKKTVAAHAAGDWQSGDALIQPSQPVQVNKKRKRGPTSAEESSDSSLASSNRPKRVCRTPSRYRGSNESSSSGNEGSKASPKKKTTGAAMSSPSSASSAPKKSSSGRSTSRKAVKSGAFAAKPVNPSQELFTEQEYAWIHQLKNEPGVSRTWKDVARYMNAIQGHSRTSGAFQASYSRNVATAIRENGGVVPHVYSARGPHAPVPTLAL
ncbi:MAG: hypothetical protein Q9159_004118 [Coniocarpon cinnabarinum]